MPSSFALLSRAMTESFTQDKQTLRYRLTPIVQ